MSGFVCFNLTLSSAFKGVPAIGYMFRVCPKSETFELAKIYKFPSHIFHKLNKKRDLNALLTFLMAKSSFYISFTIHFVH